MTTTLDVSAIRGTCMSCGRWVTTYKRVDDNARRAFIHKAFVREGNSIARDWKQCPGSNQPVKA